MKTGRNEKCPCGSGLKHKKCCLNKKSGSGISNCLIPMQAMLSPPDRTLMSERERALELIRQQQQGLGKPIFSTVTEDQKIILVGEKAFVSKKWKTFPDFLQDYIVNTLGLSWINEELSKPLNERHIILKWQHAFFDFVKKQSKPADKIQTFPLTGIVCCYLGLAYSLYLLEHNVELQARLVKRLKNELQFQGAYYESIIANILIRAGFELALENETDRSTKHCEFSAFSKETKRKYWVEAKMRSVAGRLGQTSKTGSSDRNPLEQLIPHLNKALSKPAKDERLIFIDLNTLPSANEQPDWVEPAAKKFELREKTLKLEQKAFVFVTNMCFHLSEAPRQMAFIHGLGISDFAKPGPIRFSYKYRQKQKYIDIYNIGDSLTKFPQLPDTLDGSLPSQTLHQKPKMFQIGETYFFEDVGENGTLATVTHAVVNETQKLINLMVKSSDGQLLVLAHPIDDDSLLDYKKHPEAFFGKIQNNTNVSKNDFETYEFLVSAFGALTKEQLIEKMKDHVPIATLMALGQDDLLLLFCEGQIHSLIKQRG